VLPLAAIQGAGQLAGSKSERGPKEAQGNHGRDERDEVGHGVCLSPRNRRASPNLAEIGLGWTAHVSEPRRGVCPSRHAVHPLSA
jgi:hypothetical protein